MKEQGFIKKVMAIIVCLSILLFAAYPAFGLSSPKKGSVDSIMYYTVKPGDTLWDLALQRNIDREMLAEMNGLAREAKLFTGQVLKIPMGELVTHEVQKGETVWRIAHNYHVDYKLIMRENEFTDPRQLMAGQSILVPIPSERVAAGLSPMRESWSFSFWPVIGRVSSLFGIRDGRMHEGLDIAAPEGTPIHSVQEGVVCFAGPRGTYGNAVIIDHGKGLRTLYAHASEILVIEGELVEKGQVIAKVGNTGRSTGPHIHFEVLMEGQPQDPINCLPVIQQ